MLELELETKMMVGSINISQFWGWLKEIAFNVRYLTRMSWGRCEDGLWAQDTRHHAGSCWNMSSPREWSLCTQVYDKILNWRGWNALQVCLNTCMLLFFKVRYCAIASKEKCLLHFSLLVLDFLFYSKCERWQKPLEKSFANLKRLRNIVLRQ